jgi:hypothetical protein
VTSDAQQQVMFMNAQLLENQQEWGTGLHYLAQQRSVTKIIDLQATL